MGRGSCVVWGCGSCLPCRVSIRIPWYARYVRDGRDGADVSQIHHLQSRLSLRLRTKITRYTHDLYLSSDPHLRYYRVAGEGGLDGVDQYLTADIASWADSISGLYGNVLKPLLDLTLFTSQLARTLGARGTVALFVNYYVTARILRAVTPAFGRLAAVEARLEGEYRAGVGRVGRESEEVA